MSEPHTVIPYVVISAEPTMPTGSYVLKFQTNFGDYSGSEPAHMDDDDSKRMALGRIIESVLAVTGAQRLDIEFIV